MTKNRTGEQRHHPRRLQLEAPAERAAGLLQGDQQPRQQHERQNHADGECDTVRGHRSAVRAVLRQADQFQRQHREYARHQVQDQAADERRARAPRAATSSVPLSEPWRPRSWQRRLTTPATSGASTDGSPAAGLGRAAVGDEHPGERLRVGLHRLALPSGRAPRRHCGSAPARRQARCGLPRAGRTRAHRPCGPLADRKREADAVALDRAARRNAGHRAWHQLARCREQRRMRRRSGRRLHRQRQR